MNNILIHGGIALQGNVRIQGSKNATLPVLAATLLAKDTSYIRNCPRIADVYRMLCLLKSLGCVVKWEKEGVFVDASKVREGIMPPEAITGMRSSLYLLGALLSRNGQVVMEYPGGCAIGERPIDLHIMALSKMGVDFFEEKGKLCATTKGLHGGEIHLPFASVGATENVLLAASTAEGDTILSGAAREPEVVALCEFLEKMGVKIWGKGTAELHIRGSQKPLQGVCFVVPADRIVAGTYLFGGIATKGSVLLEEAPVEEMGAVLEVAEKLGAQCTSSKEGLHIQMGERREEEFFVKTAPYPGFPTDLQSALLATASVSKGNLILEETIFENRFRIVKPLQKMGAHIETLSPSMVRVKGVEALRGAKVEAKELRGGAALVIGGLAAEKQTLVKGSPFIDRGYENICRDFRELGARIVGV